MVTHTSGGHVPQPALFRCIPCLFPCLRVLPSLGSTWQGAWTNLQFETPTDAVDNTSATRPALVIDRIRYNHNRELQTFGSVNGKQTQRGVMLFDNWRLGFLRRLLLLRKKAVKRG